MTLGHGSLNGGPRDLLQHGSLLISFSLSPLARVKTQRLSTATKPSFAARSLPQEQGEALRHLLMQSTGDRWRLYTHVSYCPGNDLPGHGSQVMARQGKTISKQDNDRKFGPSFARVATTSGINEQMPPVASTGK